MAKEREKRGVVLNMLGQKMKALEKACILKSSEKMKKPNKRKRLRIKDIV